MRPGCVLALLLLGTGGVGSAVAAETTTVLPARLPLALSSEERQWIADHRVVRVGFSPSYAPFSMPAGKGKMEGIDLDYLDLIARRTGLEFRPVVKNDWPSVEQAFAQGEVDLLTTLIASTEQREKMLLTKPYLQSPTVIVSRTDSPYLLQPTDLNGKLVGTVRGYLAPNGRTAQLLARAKLMEFDQMIDVFTALSSGQLDATVTDAINAAYTIKSRHLANLRLGSALSDATQLYFGVRRDAPLLASILDKALADITVAERGQVDDRWVSLEARPSVWLFAFKVSAGVILVIGVAALLLWWHQRQLEGELRERRRVQEALQVAHGQLAQLSEQKSDLLRMVVHDIRGPLTGLLLTTELATTAPVGPEPVQSAAENADLRAVLTQVRLITLRLAHLVDELVTVQQVEDGHRVYRKTPVDLPGLVNEAVAALQFEARRKQITVLTPVPPAGMPPLQSDALALRQVIDNLLSNAVKYSPAGTQVAVTLGPSDASSYELRVRDQGPGITPAEMGRIFQRYGRGQARPTGGENSTGLGLWIARKITAELGGSLRCESQPGQGATFILKLPVG